MSVENVAIVTEVRFPGARGDDEVGAGLTGERVTDDSFEILGENVIILRVFLGFTLEVV